MNGGKILLYYRYRPIGELSLKELRYNEIYFSSATESNDPYDGKVFLSYKFDKDKWKRLLLSVWKNVSFPKFSICFNNRQPAIFGWECRADLCSNIAE